VRPPSIRTSVAVALVALLVTGCGLVSTSPPPAGPEDFAGISTRLASRGISISNVVSGDSGCDDQELGRTAIRFEASGRDQREPATFYLYIFRNRSVYERLGDAVATCATAYVRDAGAPQPLEISPYVLVSPDRLEPAFAEAIREGLRAAAGTGG
jgi:hypothetical protein